MGCGVGVDVVFEADPSDEGGAEYEVEKAFIRDREDDEDRGEGEEDNNKAVEVILVGLHAVEEWDGERLNCLV